MCLNAPNETKPNETKYNKIKHNVYDPRQFKTQDVSRLSLVEAKGNDRLQVSVCKNTPSKTIYMNDYNPNTPSIRQIGP